MINLKYIIGDRVITHNPLYSDEQAYDRYKSWEVVLEKAMGANAGMDACCGLYDEYHHLYLAESE